MASVRARHNRFEAKVRVPTALRDAHDGREFLYRTLTSTSRKVAQVEADAWEAGLRVEWAGREGMAQDARANLRRVYEETLQAAAAGRFQVHMAGEDPVDAGIDYEIAKIADAAAPDEEPSPEETARLAALHDARTSNLGRMLVALFSGMRLDEIAGLTWGNLREVEGVRVIDIRDAKTPAGERLVPIHPAVQGLLRDQGQKEPTARIWPGFNPEGPGKKAGADAGREFTRFKQSLGFTDRAKAFHSFRKNAVAQWEAASVPETEVAQIVGHEKKGITFGVYGRGVSIHRKAMIVAMLAYPSLPAASVLGN